MILYNPTLHTEYFNEFMYLEVKDLEKKFNEARNQFAGESSSLANRMRFMAVNDAIKIKKDPERITQRINFNKNGN